MSPPTSSDLRLMIIRSRSLAARTVHIAGTKGKGSVAAMIAQVLSVSGYKTGLYTSHVITL